jgi:hypothetical protein
MGEKDLKYKVGDLQHRLISAYRDALAVQDACNLSGVVHSFSRHMKTLGELELDTDEKNRHPVAVLFSSKIASLTHSEPLLAFNYAYDMATKAVEQFKEEPQVQSRSRQRRLDHQRGGQDEL